MKQFDDWDDENTDDQREKVVLTIEHYERLKKGDEEGRKLLHKLKSDHSLLLIRSNYRGRPAVQTYTKDGAIRKLTKDHKEEIKKMREFHKQEWQEQNRKWKDDSIVEKADIREKYQKEVKEWEDTARFYFRGCMLLLAICVATNIAWKFLF